MILLTLTTVDGQTYGKQSPELRKTNSDMICAILSREEELLEMPLDKTTMFFACLSRYIAIIDEEQDEPTEATAYFEQYKERYAATLVNHKELKVGDIFALSMAFAAEQIKSPEMWEAFALIAVEQEYKVPENEYFKSYANLAWALTKANYAGANFW